MVWSIFTEQPFNSLLSLNKIGRYRPTCLETHMNQSITTSVLPSQLLRDLCRSCPHGSVEWFQVGWCLTRNLGPTMLYSSNAASALPIRRCTGLGAMRKQYSSSSFQDVLQCSLSRRDVGPRWKGVQVKQGASPSIDGQSDTKDSKNVHDESCFSLRQKKHKHNESPETCQILCPW